jgi:hypothetical protein
MIGLSLNNDMNFKEFINNNDIIDGYFNKKEPVRKLSKATGKSVGSIYRTIYNYGTPNRVKNNHHFVKSLNDLGLKNKNISKLTGYSTRHVRNIIKNGNSNQ